ncbi:unnamed protein product [Lampetra fluviatilis]
MSSQYIARMFQPIAPPCGVWGRVNKGIALEVGGGCSCLGIRSSCPELASHHVHVWCVSCLPSSGLHAGASSPRGASWRLGLSRVAVSTATLLHVAAAWRGVSDLRHRRVGGGGTARPLPSVAEPPTLSVGIRTRGGGGRSHRARRRCDAAARPGAALPPRAHDASSARPDESLQTRERRCSIAPSPRRDPHPAPSRDPHPATAVTPTPPPAVTPTPPPLLPVVPLCGSLAAACGDCSGRTPRLPLPSPFWTSGHAPFQRGVLPEPVLHSHSHRAYLRHAEATLIKHIKNLSTVTHRGRSTGLRVQISRSPLAGEEPSQGQPLTPCTGGGPRGSESPPVEKLFAPSSSSRTRAEHWTSS